jgi:hypothetical protein
VRLFGRTLVTVALVQEKHDEKKHEHSGEVEWRKQGLGTCILESGFDTDLTRHIDDGRDGGKVHLLPKKDVFSTAKQRTEEIPTQNGFDRRTFLNRRDVQGSRSAS